MFQKGKSANPVGRPKVPNPARDEAVAKGINFYVSSTPCIHGHITRWVSSGHCVECVRKKQREHFLANKVEIARKRKEQRHAHRASHPIKNRGRQESIVVVDGQTFGLKEACEKLKIAIKTVYNRANTLKVSHQKAIDWYILKRDNPKDIRVKRAPVKRKKKESIFADLHSPAVENGSTRLAASDPPIQGISNVLRVKESIPLTSNPKYYLENTDLLIEIAKSKEKNKVTDRLAMMMMLMAKRFFSRHNYYRYSYVDEMRDEALMIMLVAVFKFNPEKSSNPFSYLTQVMKNSANRILTREKKGRETIAEQRVILDDMMEEEAPGSRSRGDSR